MKKQYMDFVPAKSGKGTVKGKTGDTRVGVTRASSASKSGGAARSAVARSTRSTVSRTVAKKPVVRTRVVSKEASYQEFEELDSLRILAEEARTRKIEEKPVTAKEVKAVKAAKAKKVDFDKKGKKAKDSYQIPRNPFINQGRVAKRPLSKNVYQKKVETPVEEPKGPVTIIAKPEKDSKVGLIVTIIITIILGAAAGTVAFLLLPK